MAICRQVNRVSQAAYLSCGMQQVAFGETLKALAFNVTRQSFRADRYQLRCVWLSKKNKISTQNAIHLIADAINGLPDLNNPLHRLVIIAHDSGFYLGEILSNPTRSYEMHKSKPYHTTNSLPSQLARAVVNLAYPSRTILDPCCGTGSLLLEACATGIAAFGMDRNPKMVGMTRLNLNHFGYQAVVEHGDARQCTITAEAIVTDFPYGRFSILNEENLKGILRQMPALAPFGIYLAGQDVSSWLYEVGYKRIEVFRVQKRAGMMRYVHRARLI
jgi:tRNA (guanine10-N2)-dimethyltransferase